MNSSMQREVVEQKEKKCMVGNVSGEGVVNEYFLFPPVRSRLSGSIKDR